MFNIKNPNKKARLN